MSYRVRRIDPYWNSNPVFALMAIGGAAMALYGTRGQNTFVLGGGALVAAIGVLALTKPVVSAVLGSLGLCGGVLQFIALPNVQMLGLSFPTRLLSALLFGAIYMVLMNAIVLVVSFIYNGFSVGLGGISLEFDEAAQEE